MDEFIAPKPTETIGEGLFKALFIAFSWMVLLYGAFVSIYQALMGANSLDKALGIWGSLLFPYILYKFSMTLMRIHHSQSQS